MKAEDLRDIKFPTTELETEKYVEWFLANGWHIENVEYKDKEYPAFVKVQDADDTIGLNITDAAKELCGLEIELETVPEGQKVKIITNMTVKGFC